MSDNNVLKLSGKMISIPMISEEQRNEAREKVQDFLTHLEHIDLMNFILDRMTYVEMKHLIISEGL